MSYKDYHDLVPFTFESDAKIEPRQYDFIIGKFIFTNADIKLIDNTNKYIAKRYHIYRFRKDYNFKQ